jgi:hypothetical protein
MSADTMRIHDDWQLPAFDFEPVATRTGPFVRRELLRVWIDVLGDADAVRLVEGDLGMVALYSDDVSTRMVGDAGVIDYRSPLGSGISQLLGKYLEGVEPGERLHFDSLPAEAAAVVAGGFARAGIPVEPVQHEMSTVLEIPTDEELWLENLDRKQRHEVRRKARKFEAASGPISLSRKTGEGAVAEFVAMHRLAAGDKGTFMSPKMVEFFTALEARSGAVVDFLEGADGPIAAAFGFEDADCYYFYNSAYRPDSSDLSPGIILVLALVRQAIRSGKQVFDFLKGDEMYKFRLGAKPRPLYEITATVGNRP